VRGGSPMFGLPHALASRSKQRRYQQTLYSGMPIHNADIARIFEVVADLLDLKGENRFRIRAYRNAARTLAQLSRPV